MADDQDDWDRIGVVPEYFVNSTFVVRADVDVPVGLEGCDYGCLPHRIGHWFEDPLPHQMVQLLVYFGFHGKCDPSCPEPYGLYGV